ncbi:phosphoribosylaminoimidazolecarboxamide formyltransferase/IMP cyclohydrolase [Thermocrinis albus DSM 14484]|uniref:Bifunctional purine biosynthesis protein PurH n=1 Tax=Thermocrinis albus (strain DSM 14484 / JCM 11386 / HI 11/12) TaxID=638303 RepID=D3SN80_THEAH|nr:bifunctional phosphoribosylaminoimidazolecarboxamide formyltransferase/IMP cyclohydrolase [Thermocrinis albus]ADC90210.1 phosphoribosylaminoimidazolecarboxamide formyltransferase/IMP cyclohydrolase [Thermocrinis albus DSM 14484]
MRAIISVYHKEGVEELASVLVNLGYEIVSSGGTAQYLRERRIPVTEVFEITGFPEILGGRVKTLHPAIHGGILLRDWKEEDVKEAKSLGIKPIQVVVVNLYPFEEKVKENLEEEDLIEFIDIGGPTLLRAAAKNFRRVVVVCDPKDYSWVASKLKEGGLSLEDRRWLALKAFHYTAYYDGVISQKLADMWGVEEPFEVSAFPLRIVGRLRYGENPHQRGYLAENPLEDLGIVRARVLQGKEMSFNNYLDADSAFRLVSEFTKPACVIVKHTNPCGVAVGNDLISAFEKALSTDPQSAFGGIVAFNDTVKEKLAEVLVERFFEVIVAPEFDDAAIRVLARKKNLRVVQALGFGSWWDIKKISGGFLLQEEDRTDYQDWQVVTTRKPSYREEEDLKFAFKICKYIKSNAVVIAKDGMTLGIGSGNVSRVDSVRCAIERALRYGFDLKGAVLASEAFLPFRDNVDIAAQVGIIAIVQPGGSVRDREVIEACEEKGISMVFTKTRHFRH